MHKIKINNSFLEYRDTPWDEKVFAIQTKEILNIEYKEFEAIDLLLKEFENEFFNDGLAYIRVNSNDIKLKQKLLENGYYIAETSLKLTHKNIQKYNFNSVFKKNLELTSDLNTNFINQLKEIASSSFNYSRFHEDPFLDINKSKQRYANWINDLVQQDKKILIYQKQEIIYSFMFYEFFEQNKVNLILGGSKLGFGQLTPSFWISVFNFLKSKDAKSIDVVISAANITILNLYIMTGFSVKECTLDYHKKIIRSK